MKSNWIKGISLAAVLLAGSLSTSAFAQYVWLNEKGVKQYSDMPPPSSVPKNRILKEAGRNIIPSVPAAPSADVAEAEMQEGTPEWAKNKLPMTMAEKNADFQKRKMEQAEKDKKAAEKEKFAADKAKNCEQARAHQRTLQSGERLARTDKNGERYFLDDRQRAQEAQDSKRILDDCK